VRLALIAPLIALPIIASAQESFAGKGRYPQTRSLSGLAGGGAAVLPNGAPSIRGALALSTPIGYTLSPRCAVLTGGTTSADGSLRWFDGEVATNGSNGTAALIFGVALGAVDLGLSLVQTSRLAEDRVVNVQATPVRSGRVGVSLGVQDLLDETVTTPDYRESAQTLFVAATYSTQGLHATVGAGTRRFEAGFASLSAPLARGARGVVEHDGFGWNYGVQIALFELSTSEASFFYGACQGRYATWALSWQF
jgi:hypothetical protein